MSLFRLTPKHPGGEAKRLFTAAAETTAAKLGPLTAGAYVTETRELQPRESPPQAALRKPKPADLQDKSS